MDGGMFRGIGRAVFIMGLACGIVLAIFAVWFFTHFDVIFRWKH